MPSLERDAPTHRLRLLRDIDHAAAAFAHSLQQLVATEHLTHSFIRRLLDNLDLHGRLRYGLAGVVAQPVRLVWLVMDGQQRFEALAKRPICAADNLKKRCPFGGGLFKGQREQRGLTFLGRWHG
jgi:hypothetical protein